MATKHFDCDICGAHGKIIFKDNTEFNSSDVAFCPMCGGDIFEEEDYEDFDE
jgi:rRNA maturation endonuclease Nob1